MKTEMTNGWRLAKVGDALTDASPGFACGEDLPDGIIHFRMHNVTREGAIDWTKVRRVPTDRKNIDRFLVKPGDLLFNSTSSPELVGKCAVFRGLDEPVTFSNHFHRLRPDPKVIDSGFLSRWITLQWKRGIFQGMCRQWVNQATVTKEQILGLSIPLPPLPEQRRIAAILDQADALRTKRRQALARLDTLTQSIFLEMFGDPAVNPNGYRVERLGDLTEIGTGSTPSREDPSNFGGDVAWVKTTEIGDEPINCTEERLTLKGLRSSRCRLFPAGSIVIAMYGQGRTRGRATMLGITAATNQACGVLLPNDTYDSQFLLGQLRISYSQLRSLGRGGNQENLNLGLLADFPVMVPSISAQRDFAMQISHIEKLKAVQRSGLGHFEHLFAALQNVLFMEGV